MNARASRVVSILFAASVGCSGGDGGSGGPPPLDPVQLRVERVFAALPPFQQPVALMQAPNDAARWFVVEQGGRILTFDNTPLVGTPTPFLDITARVTSGGELGLLGLAFHPAFPADPRAYAFYSHTDASLGLVSRLSE